MPEELTPIQMAYYFRVHPVTLKRWEKNNWFPIKPTRINSRGDRRYSWEAVKKFINEN